MIPLLAGLNPRQAEAVSFTGAPELVLAGAGSGKTRVLTAKIAYLIGELGVAPYRIVALTFTNKAAREMEARVKALVGEDLQGMQVSTFHSYGLRFLHRHSGELARVGLPENFAVFDRGDSKAIVKRAMKRLGLEGKSNEAGGLMDRISRAKASCDPRTLDVDIDERYRALYDEYQRDLRSQGAVDFDDLMILPIYMMSTMPEVLERERRRVEWTLVDEYQDVSAPQYELMRLLVGDGGRVMAVGDPDQSIYGWRGADMSLIMNFENDFPGARVIVLDQNYRSTGNILDAANAVIRRNADRHDKDLWTAAPRGRPAYVLRAKNDLEERAFIADRIEELAADGYKYSEMAILYRMNALSRSYEQELLERGIPHRVVRGVAFYDRREVKDVISMMRLAFCPLDRASLERVANVPARGIGPKGVQTLADYLARAEGTPSEVWAEMANAPPLKGKAGAGAAQFARAMAALCEAADVEDAVEMILNDLGYRDFLAEEYPDDFEDRLDNIMELLSVVPDEGSIAEILSEIALYTDAESSNGDGVSLLTLHAAKGLEFPIVFVVGFEEGVFPSVRATDEPGGIEEERRLCYVGMTRARERLFISGAASRMLFGGFQRSPFSRFLGELPSDCITLDDRTGGVDGGGRGQRYVHGGTDRRRWRW